MKKQLFYPCLRRAEQKMSFSTITIMACKLTDHKIHGKINTFTTVKPLQFEIITPFWLNNCCYKAFDFFVACFRFFPYALLYFYGALHFKQIRNCLHHVLLAKMRNQTTPNLQHFNTAYWEQRITFKLLN